MAKTDKAAKKSSATHVELTSEMKLKLGADKTPAGKDRWVRLLSSSDPSYFLAIPVTTVKQFGMPIGPDGEPMVVRQGGGRLSDEEKERRRKEKEAEAAKLEAMTPEERAEYKRKKREEAAEKRRAKKAEERAKLIAEIKADIAAGKV